MNFNASASGYKLINNFYTNEILPYGISNIGSNSSPFENGFFNNLILSNVSSNNVILSNLTSENLRFTNGTGNNLIINNTINSNTISTENLRFNFATGNNLIINNTINSNTISTGNLRFTNGTGNNLIINNTINSNTISAGNIFNTNQTANLLHINNRINISNTQQSISQIPVFIEANNDQNFLVVSAGGGGSFSTKRSGLILGRQRNDLTTFRIENNSNGNLEIYSGVGSSINLYHNTSGSNIFNINSSRLSTGNIVNTNTTLQNLRALNITTENIDITRGGVNLLTFNFATGSNLKMNNNIEAVSISATNGNINNLTTSNLITTNISSSNSTITNLISSNISTSNISSNNLQVSNSTINSLRFNNFNSPFRYATNGTFDLNIDDSLKIDDGKLEIGNIGTYLRGVKGIQTLNATLMLDQVNDLFGFTVFDDVEDFTEQLGVNVDAVFVNTFINEDHFKFGNGFPFSYIPPFPLELKLPSNNQIVFIRDNKLTGDNSLKFNQATQSCTIENLEGEHIDFRDASFTYITSGNIRSTNLLYGPNLYVNNLHSCANATMTNLKVNNVLTFDSLQGDLISTKNMLLVNITCSNIKANNKITSDVLDSSIISAGSILTNHITSSNLRINTTASINNLQCEVAFIGGMSVGNATMNNLRILQGMTCESIRANDTISSLTFSSANLINKSATLGNVYLDNINQNIFGYNTFSNMIVINTLGSNVISCANLWTDNTISSRVLSVADLFSINGTMDNLKINSGGSITLLSSGNIFNDNTISSNAISCSNLWCNGTISSRTLSLTNLFNINGTMDNLKVNSIGSFGLISCGSLFTDNTLSSTAISTNNIFANNITLSNLRINNHAKIDNLLATNITITNAVPRITLRDTQASTDNEVVCRGYLKDLNSWMSGELSTNMMLSAGKLKADLQAGTGITVTDDKIISVNAGSYAQWNAYNARISACETGVAASGALITFLNTSPVPNSLFVGAPQFFVFLIGVGVANTASASTALGVGSDALAKVDRILAGTEDLTIPTLNSININTTNLSASNFTVSNVVLNGTSLNSIITDTNTSINNINTGITAPSNLIATNLTTTNLQLNESSLNTIITGITAPSNLIATNLTTTNLQLNGSNLNTIITNLSSSTTNLTAPSNLISTNLTGQSLKITNIYQDGWLEYKAEGFPGFKIYPTSGTNGELIFNRDGGKILTIDEYLYVNTGLTTPNINSTNLTTTNLQLNGSSLNTILTGITAPSNLIATNLTTTNAVINSFSRHLKIDGGLTGLPEETNFDLYLTGNDGSPNIGSLYIGDGTGWGFNFKRRASSTDTVIGRIHDNGDFWMSNGISTSNLLTTNLQLNGSSLNTVLTNTFTSINNLSALTSANLSNISSSNICSGNIFTTNQTVLNNLIVNGNVGIRTDNTAGVNLNVNNPSGTCRVRASGRYIDQQGFGIFDTTNNQESWSIIREGNQDNLIIYRNSATMTFNMTPSGNLGLIGSLSCGNLRASAITCSNLTVSSGNTRLDFVVGNRGSSPVDGWTTLDPNGGSNQGLFIWDGLEVSGPITCSNLRALNTINSSVISSGSVLSTNGRFTNFTTQNILMRGASNNLSGPHINIFNDAVNHQTFQQLNWNSDNVSLAFNAYWNGSTWNRASGTSCFQIYKLNGRLEFNFEGPAGVAGDTLTWQNSFAITNTGIVSGASFQLTNLAGLNSTLSNSLLNNATINNLMIPSGTNSNITLGNSYITSRISAGSNSTFRHFKRSRLVQKGSASIGNLDIEECDVIALDPTGINQTCFLPNVLTNIPLNYSGEFTIRHNADTNDDITLSTIANGSFIYPANQLQVLTARQFATIKFVKTGNTTATYYINKSTS